MSAWLEAAAKSKTEHTKSEAKRRAAATASNEQRAALGDAIAAAHANAKAALKAEKAAAIAAGTYVAPVRVKKPQPKRDPNLPSNSFQ